ncbi:hypothetical protein CPHO_08340 [Corynebacterium phocae]|uniref:Phage protein n=1 Tax=Corynebacterium phocae TaxID=161895 RepID=A0A1L7D4G1_9CORY|nr:hypothetical protein [Corynebacterium phocae]APT92893.1 hypothetical protein CPHO_08340 [Corynebacterium phocae]KAA8723215.1 hypothetical protein F4V58_07835 [Corynebacterium phocae]
MNYPVYATLETLQTKADPDTLTKLSELPERTVERLLNAASRAVRWYTRAARYDTDDYYLPTDETIRTAMADATALHALSLIEMDLVNDVLSGGVAAGPEVKSTSENGASLTFDNTAHTTALNRLRAGHLATEAEWVLKDAGLLAARPLIHFRGW